MQNILQYFIFAAKYFAAIFSHIFIFPYYHNCKLKVGPISE